MEQQKNEKVEELLTTNLLIVKTLEKKATMFGKGMLVLSLLDCIFGLLAIFCTSLTLTAFFASATSLTAITICGRVIQINKIQQLEKSLRTLNLLSLAWFVNKYKKYIKKGESKVKTEKLSAIQIASIIGAVVGIAFAIVSVFVPAIAIAGDSIYNIFIATGVETICAFAGSFKGYKKLTDDEIAKLEAKKAKKAEKEKATEVAKAQAIIDEYENAKKVVAEANKQ